MTTPEFRGDDARAVRRELNYLRTRLDELARANPARSTAIPDGNGVVRARYGIDGFHWYDETGAEVTRFDADGAHWYDASGNEVVRVDITGLHVLNAAGVEQVAAGNLGSGVYGLEVIRAGVPVNLADYVFGAGFARISTPESTTSASYTDLATIGPSVTVVVGPTGKVWLNGGAITLVESTAAHSGMFGATVAYAASGANTIGDTELAYLGGYDQDGAVADLAEAAVSSGRLLTGLTPGSTTFKLRYKADVPSPAIAQFRQRWLQVQPL